jgi:hypothetical protein
MRGVVTVGPGRLCGVRVVGRAAGGPRHGDGAGALGGVRGGGEVARAGGVIAEAAAAVLQRDVHGLADEGRPFGAAGGGHVERGQHLKRLDHGVAGGGPEGADHLVTAVAAAHDDGGQRAERGQPLAGDETSMARHVGVDRVGHPAPVEAVVAVLGDGAQRPAEVPLDEAVAGGVGGAVRAQEIARGSRVAAQLVGGAGHEAGLVLRQREAVLGVADRGLEHAGARQPAVALVEGQKRGGQAGDRGAIVAVGRVGAGPVALRHLVQTVDGHDLAGRRVEHDAGAAAESGHGRFDDVQREAGRDGGVDGVAALGQDARADGRGEGRGAGDHALARPRELLRRVRDGRLGAGRHGRRRGRLRQRCARPCEQQQEQ